MRKNNPDFIRNKYITLNLKIKKFCYLPGEEIKGDIILKGKPELKNTLLTEPKSVIKINQEQQYMQNLGENGYTKITLNKTIFQKELLFNTFIGANLLLGVKIPFSINLPIFSHPTCIFNKYDFVRHILSIEFPSLKVKNSFVIIVKNITNFTKENKLLRVPCILSGKISKSKFFINKGNYTISINLSKNVFYYDEPISYEIYLNYK